MISIVKTISTNIVEAFRQVKVLRFGKDDVQTPDECSPFGLDSNAVKDMAAVYAETSNCEEPILIGYLQKNRLAQIGEFRIYSTDSAGAEKTYVWLKNNGDIEIGGNSDHMVRYSKLEVAFNELRRDFNTLVSQYNAHTHIYNPGPLPPASTAATIASGTSSSADITPAKINTIKTL